MAMKYKRGFCKDCNKDVKVFTKAPNHILHLLLSIITAGIWLIVWIMACISHDPWRCDECGSKKISKVS
jgi:hypothetical protein